MLEQFKQFIEQKCPGAQPLFIAIRGSQAYGTQIPTSDTDYAGVYIQSQSDIYGTKYKEQINDDKNDTVFYEVKRFLELVASNNPTILELLNTPEDCILYKHPLYNLILEHKNKFITKVCAKSFGGYGIQQIKKAKGQNKKQNWEKEKVTRKDLLDFCYVLKGEQTIPWKQWNLEKGYEEKFIGITNVEHARDLYVAYYDYTAFKCFSESIDDSVRESIKALKLEQGLPLGLGYKGLTKEKEDENTPESNQLRLSSIPKGQTIIANILYNKDAYTQHCKDFKSYQEWLTNRNEQRWIDVKSHEQRIDGKNMMHCRRLLDMAREIGEGRGIIVRRPNAKDLIAIRKGEVDLQSLIDHAETELLAIDEIFRNSDLPNTVDPALIHEILTVIRTEYYGR
jgi:predicted nucleotidyltransferase